MSMLYLQLSINVFFFRAVGHVMSSLFYPLLTFALLAVVIAYWAITAVYPFIFPDDGRNTNMSMCHFSFLIGQIKFPILHCIVLLLILYIFENKSSKYAKI